MSGVLVFASLADAKREGFIPYDRTPDGWIVRKQIDSQWHLALVVPPTPRMRERSKSKPH